MNRSRRRSLIILLALGVTAGLAAKPGGGGGSGGSTVETYPPVVPAHDFAAFVSRPDLGGVLDTEANLVWGYSYSEITRTAATYNARLSAGSRYPVCFAERAAEHEYWGNRYLEIAEEEPDRAELYLAASAEEFRMADALVAAGLSANQYVNWRLPTLAEARAAVAKGLFTAGDGGLNLWTKHPADLVITPPYPSSVGYWTADDAGRRKQDTVGWAYDAGDGSA